MQPFNTTAPNHLHHQGTGMPPTIMGVGSIPINLPPPPAVPTTGGTFSPFGVQTPGVIPPAPFSPPFPGLMPTGYPMAPGLQGSLAGMNPSMFVTMASMFNMAGSFGMPDQSQRGAGDAPGQSNEQAEGANQVTQSVWREHRTNEGRIFWHNTKTGKSTWDKPDELKTDLEKVLATSTSWREYPGGDGKTYWHNLETKQSEWDVPQEVREIQERMEALAAEDWSGRQFDGKVQAKAEFRTFLERRGIGHKARWDDVGKIIQNDKKWSVFDKYLTPGERKHVFNELVNQLQKKHREEQRAKKAAARDALAEYLSKWRQGENGSVLQPMTTYEEFVDRANGEPWFHLLENVDKAEAFEDVAQAVADETCKRPSKQKTEELLQFFNDVADTELKLDTPAEGVVEVVKASFDDTWLATMPPANILNVWQRYVLDRPEIQRQKTRAQLYRHDRRARECFKAMLRDAEKECLLDAKSEWADFLNGPVPKQTTVPCDGCASSDLDKVMEKVQSRVRDWVMSDTQRSADTAAAADDGTEEDGMRDDNGPEESDDTRIGGVCTDPRYLRMFFQGGSTPKELFEDFVYELWDIYEELRPVLKRHLTTGQATALNALLSSPKLPTVEEFAAVVESEMKLPDHALEIEPALWSAANRPGVLNPLILSLAKKLRRSVPEEESGDRGV
eukprot:Blabericola_migrator_1__811@NODE_11_length_24785_cov_110_100736_g8_i0_p3_GENE_NODE_11_length_24785_cov_110_100736_g8_i0NODE_11_length_24785_cov_110_100736_g8_i0_p3_ORF_typecomplete_len674_score119_76FF/PF01846_19/7_6e03FF/PF01846_19/6_5e08FF/PF01846_19/1_4e02FF/PF01846_19/1_6FF/PF01846_19/0_48WW/PF00397_26/3_7e07WW/PF00397_26/0_18RhoGAPFF1/PF16512_5/0_34Ntox28/PF15605_6/7_6e02Ntox28/PF15605_6/2_9e03Ntox28/PF15605_6/1_8PSII_Pbs27/PF13326_6/0_65Glyco_hyd_101C/PF17451_2/1_3Glyco_hyd_101C/PF17451_2/